MSNPTHTPTRIPTRIPNEGTWNSSAPNGNPIRRSLSVLNKMRLRSHLAAAGLSFIALGIINAVLNSSYERSRFPVPYAEGQTTFDGAKLKEFYRFMIDQDTLGIYWQTQFIDFGFIAAMAAVGLTIGSLVARLHRPGSRPARLGIAAAWLISLGAAFDAVENLISFTMLARPESFPNWLAIPYSTAAVIKFALITCGMLSLAIAIAALAAKALLRLARSTRA